MKKILNERLGVPDGLYQASVKVYEGFIRHLEDELNESQTDYTLNFKLNPPAQIGDMNLDNINFNVKLFVTDKVDSPKFLEWSQKGKIRTKIEDKKLKINYKLEVGSVNLGVEMAVPENWDVTDLKIFLSENYKSSISSIAHELKHLYDDYKSKGVNSRKLISYHAAKKMMGSIKPFQRLAFNLYYTSNIESLVRPSEIATQMILQDIDKSKFLDFLLSNKTYLRLQKISQFSKEKFKKSLYNYIDEIKEILEGVGKNLDDYQNDDELVNAMIELWVKTFRNRNKESFTHFLADDFIERMFGVFKGEKREIYEKFVKNKLDTLMSDPNKFLDKTEKLFKFVSMKMIKKLSKLYDYIGHTKMNESIVNFELYAQLKNKNIFEDSFVNKQGNLSDFEKIFYDFDNVRDFVEWFQETHGEEARRQGWDIYESDSSEPNEKYFSIRLINNKPVEGYYYVVERIDEPKEGEAVTGKLKNDFEAKRLAEKMKIMVDEYGVIYGFKGWEFFPIE